MNSMTPKRKFTIRARANHMRHPNFTRMTYIRQRMGKSPYITRPNRFRHHK